MCLKTRNKQKWISLNTEQHKQKKISKHIKDLKNKINKPDLRHRSNDISWAVHETTEIFFFSVIQGMVTNLHKLQWTKIIQYISENLVILRKKQKYKKKKIDWQYCGSYKKGYHDNYKIFELSDSTNIHQNIEVIKCFYKKKCISAYLENAENQSSKHLHEDIKNSKLYP